MKTLTIAEFKALLASNDWQQKQEHEVLHCIPFVEGLACKTSTFDGFEIKYLEYFSYDKNGSDLLDIVIQDEVWMIEGISSVVDESGKRLKMHELTGYLTSYFSHIDYYTIVNANTSAWKYLHLKATTFFNRLTEKFFGAMNA